MSNILLVTSSPRGEASLSTKIATELAEKLHAALPGSIVTRRDLVANPLPHIDPDYSTGIYLPTEQLNPAQARVVGVSDGVLEELFAADHVILATGLINFSISSTLKSWIDHIARRGKTFAYSANGPEGLVKGKKIYVALASGGVYSEGPAAPLDFAVPYLKSLLGFLGMTDVEVIRVEGVGMGDAQIKKSLEAAGKQADSLAARAGQKAKAAAA